MWLLIFFVYVHSANTQKELHHNVTHLCPTQHKVPDWSSRGAHFRETPPCVEKGQQHLFSYGLFLNAGTLRTAVVFLIHTKDYVFWQAIHLTLLSYDFYNDMTLPLTLILSPLVTWAMSYCDKMLIFTY